MLVRNYLDKSSIHGLGVFAGEVIRKGTKIWEFTPSIDLILTENDVSRLSNIQTEWLLTYVYRELTIGKLILCSDNAKYFNFSATPNTGGSGEDTFSSYAIRDIKEGEELTFSVSEDIDAKSKLGSVIYQSLLDTTRT